MIETDLITVLTAAYFL